ncbi:MAG: carboxypeptidase regulatory-like domain-containing protein, partial [Bacteroidota bacterium]
MRTFTRFLQMLFVVVSMTLTFATPGSAQTTLMTQSFENGGSVPTGWATEVVTAGNTISFVPSTSWPAGYTAYNGTYLVMFNSFTSNGGVNRLKMTTPISTTGYTNVNVDFAWLESSGYAGVLDRVDVQWSTNGVTWTTAGTFNRYNTVQGWKIKTQPLPAGAQGQATLYIAFLFTSAYGNDCYLDFTNIADAGSLLAGTLTGTITNCYNNAPLAGVLVTCGTQNTTTNAAGVFTIVNVPIGTYTMTATCVGFLPMSCLVTILQNQVTVALCGCMNPIPAYLTGVCKSSATGNPLIGATITVGTSTTLSTGPNGAYTLNIYPAVPGTSVCMKAGWDDCTAGPFNFTPGNTIVHDCFFYEKTNPPDSIIAAVNTSQSAVNINWSVPKGNYELIYDDGIPDNFTVWSVAGNYNAVKFSPVGYPCKINGVKINIGYPANYPPGSNPLVPFQLLIFDATGPNGTPGTQIAGPFDYTPAGYYWNSINFSTPVNISSGDFYVVMKQGGSYPNAAGIAIDTTTTQLRSYQKFVTGSGPWVAASGNFMIRALMYGPNGPVPQMVGKQQEITASGEPHALFELKPSVVRGTPGEGSPTWTDGDAPLIITGFQTWRLLQGQESVPATWVNVGTSPTTSITDNSWPTLPCNPYRWAIKAQYTGNRWSNSAFSNAIGKCWTAVVTINFSVSCTYHSPANTIVKLQNSVYSDTLYEALVDSTGTIVFDHVWKGTYTLMVKKFGYATYTQSPLTIIGNMTIGIALQQLKTPPTRLEINDRSLVATWQPPRFVD